MAIQWRDQRLVDPELVLDSVQLPDGNKYFVKDTEAREKIETLIGATRFMGVTTTSITDGSTTNPITINGESYTAETGDIVIYTPETGPSLEFIWDGSRWQLLGGQAIENLGTLAYKNSATGSYTPEGTVNLSFDSVSVINDVNNGNLEAVVTISDTTIGLSNAHHVTFTVDLGSNAETDINYLASASLQEELATVLRAHDFIIPSSVVTQLNIADSESVITDLTGGILPTISNTQTITAAMGTGNSSTTLIFSLSDIGFSQGAFSTPNKTDIIGFSTAMTPVTYSAISYGTAQVVSAVTLDTSFETQTVVTGTSTLVSLYYEANLTGSISATTTSALTSLTSATFSGSTSTITVT